MKAIIMAGGEGSRLRPLTCGRPKPLVPVLNRPVMAHIIELLRKNGIIDIGVTLQYQPEAIRDYFSNGAEYGVNLRYFVEETPLGTAGSVKNAAGFLDETFLVISGDALTDLNLSQAVDFHKKQGSLATLVLTKVACPLEYGVVITGKDGKIRRFLEKPGWSEVFSDTVNTGIYVLEPEVLEYVVPGKKTDFSQDLFPLLLKKRMPLFGIVLAGYWCDIGDLTQYLLSQHAALSGKINISMPGTEVVPGVWVEKGALINPAASIKGPVLIGADCQLGAGAMLEPFTVLGHGCLVQERASIKRSVLWNNVYVGSGAALRGAILGNRVQVQSRAGIYEGAVVGDDSVIMENSLLKPDVKLWPHKLVETGATVQQSLIWGTCSPKKLFGSEGIGGLINVEITPETAVRAGAAFGSVSGSGARLAVSADSYSASLMIKEAVISGMQSVGAEVLDIGTGITPMHRYGVRSLKCSGGVHIKVSPLTPDKMIMVFTDARGANISKSLERKIENTLTREDFPRVEASRVIPPMVMTGMPMEYISAVSAGLNKSSLRKAEFKLLLNYDRVNLEIFVANMCGELGLSLINNSISNNINDGCSYCGNWYSSHEMLPSMARAVVETGADMGAALDPNADRLIIIDGKGRVVQEDLLIALISLIILKERGGTVVVPVTAPRAIETLAERYRGKVVRTKTAPQDFLDKVLTDAADLEEISQFFLHFDALSSLAKILDFMAGHNTSLTELLDEVPAIFTDKREVPVSWEAKGKVIRYLIQDFPGSRLELMDGVKVYHPDGWALVLPDPDEPVCRVFSEGNTMEIAESLTEFYINRISNIVGIKN